MTDLILWLFNKATSRITLGVIIAGTVLSPFLNGFSELVIWFSLSMLILVALIISILTKFQFTTRNVWICYAILILFAAFLVYLYFAFGS